MSNLLRAFLACALAVVAVTAWSAFAPSHLNWGVHFLAFFDPPVRIVFLALSLLLLLPAVHNRILPLLDGAVQRIAKIPTLLLFVLFSASLVAVWLAYPSKLHLLGDGALILRSTPAYEGSTVIPPSYRNQPLVWFLYLSARAILQLFTAPTARDNYFLIDVVSGISFLALIFWWMGKLQRPALEKVLLGSLILFSGGFQFFFGYVENYVTQYVATAAFAVMGWFALEKKVHVALPLLLFVLLVGLHLGSVVFAPAALYLLVRRSSASKLRTVLILGGAGIAGVGLFVLMGFNIVQFAMHFLNGSPDFLPLLPQPAGYFPYSMFSGLHLIDWMNARFLILPLGMIIPVLFFIGLRKEIEWKNPVLTFLVITTLCGFAFTVLVNSALGMARDWDLFSSFYVPLIVLNVYLLQMPFKIDGRRPIIFVTVMFGLLNIVPFIVINGNEEKHLARLEMLNDTRFLSVTSRMFYDDALGNYFYDHAGYEKSKHYYSEYVRYDSVNPRILGNLADSYRRLGEKEAYFNVLVRAASLGSPNPGVFSNLGVEYAGRGDTVRAIEMNLKCLAMDSLQTQAHANLAILYLNSNNPHLAIRYATSAIAVGLKDPLMYRIRAKAYIKLEEYPKAVEEYDRYLSLVPGDKSIREQRERVAAHISKGK